MAEGVGVSTLIGVGVAGTREGALVGLNGEAVIIGDGDSTIVDSSAVAAIAVGSEFETFRHPANKTATPNNIQIVNHACFMSTSSGFRPAR